MLRGPPLGLRRPVPRPGHSLDLFPSPVVSPRETLGQVRVKTRVLSLPFVVLEDTFTSGVSRVKSLWFLLSVQSTA